MVEGSPIRVLLVDDDERFRAALRAILEDQGFTIAGTAGDGAEGVERAAELRPDVVTMDLEMPIMDGAEATRRICALPDPPPVVIVSGSRPSEQLQAALDAGARLHVPKRDALEVLPDILRAVLARPTD